MKLNPFDIDIQPDELARLNTPDSFKNSLTHDDVQLSKDLPIVVKYDYIDLNVTNYHFKQEFLLRDTQEYFTMMKEISSSTINDLERRARRDTAQRRHLRRDDPHWHHDKRAWILLAHVA